MLRPRGATTIQRHAEPDVCCQEGLQGSIVVFGTQPAASITLPGTGFLLQRVSVHVPPPPHPPFPPTNPQPTGIPDAPGVPAGTCTPGCAPHQGAPPQSTPVCVCVQHTTQQQQQQQGRPTSSTAGGQRALTQPRDTPPQRAWWCLPPACQPTHWCACSLCVLCSSCNGCSSCHPPPILLEPAAGLFFAPAAAYPVCEVLDVHAEVHWGVQGGHDGGQVVCLGVVVVCTDHSSYLRAKRSEGGQRQRASRKATRPCPRPQGTALTMSPAGNCLVGCSGK